MALIQKPYRATDSKMIETLQGINLFPRGAFYVQYGPTASINTTNTATSVLNNTESTTVRYYTAVAGGSPTDISTLTVPANSLQVGTVVRGTVVGSIKNNSSTPNVTFDTGMTVGSTYTALMTTGACAMISTATAAYFEFGWEYVVLTLGTAATVFGKAYWQVNSAAGVALTFDGAPGQTFGTFDSTVNNIIDAKMTWGTSHANNACVPYYAYVEIVG